MYISALCVLYALDGLVLPWLAAEESAVLAIVAASLLVFRTFRERYLLVWIVGWLAYFASRWALQGTDSSAASPYVMATSHAEFVLSICLFATAVLIYTQSRKLLSPLLLLSAAVIGFAVARALLWPTITSLRIVLEVAYRLIAVSAVISLIRFRWARWEIGSWLLCISLLLLHLNWTPLNAYLPPDSKLVLDLLFGLSMLLMAFDDFRVRGLRLSAVNALTASISEGRQNAPLLGAALQELRKLMGARATWFFMLDGERLTVSQQIGLSTDCLRDLSSIPTDGTFKRLFADPRPVVITRASDFQAIRRYLDKERFQHCVLVPVLGKKSVIGALCLGSRHRLSYTAQDLEFLNNSAHQLGLAVENLKLVEEILRSHRQWTNTFDSIQDVVLLHDSEFRVMKANQALLRKLGLPLAGVVHKTCKEVLPRDAEWQDCPYCRDNQGSFHEQPDPCFGGMSMVSTSSYVEHGSTQKGTIHVVRDVTGNHAAEEKYRLLFQQVQEGVFVSTPEGKLLDCNDAFVRMLGHADRESLMKLNVNTELYASPEQREVFRREVELHDYVRNFEVTLRRKDGTIVNAVESSFVTRDSNHKIDRYQGFLLDVTEKKRAEDEIRRRNRELNALNAMAVIATQSFDLDEILNLTLRQVISLLEAETGTIYLADSENGSFRRRAMWGQRSLKLSRSSEVKFGTGFGELVTRSRTDLITAEYLPHLPPAVAAFIHADDSNSWIWMLLWGKDDPIGLMGISSREGREYTGNDENLLVAIGRQLATTVEKVRLYEETCRAYEDLRLAQEQLLQSEKMSAVGQLIAGVAHELNNPLTAILGYAQLLETEALSDRATDFVSKLFKQAQRTHRVVQNLLSFARQRKPHKENVDVRKVLAEALSLRDYDIKVNDIQVVQECDAVVSAVNGDAHQLEQVFLNIINNAVDAILEKGRGGTLTVQMFDKGDQVHISFEDSGPGLKEPSKIFDPFYTTKGVGKGTGLGLSICYGIVKEHGGEISARNSSRGGAIVEICLPSAGHSSTSDSQAMPVPVREFAISGRILLAETEEAVLEFERDVLAGAGAQVTTVLNGEELKSKLLTYAFDAIIVDGRMGAAWSAPEVYRWLAEKYPGVEKHLLFTFSSVVDPDIRSFLEDNKIPCLVKPFEVSDLIARARQLLQRTMAATAG
ncbi:MAG: hypothetical protein NVS1B11_04250 [Terriglobales bacterium]